MKLRSWLMLLLAFLCGGVVLGVYLWVQLLSPFGYVYPEEMAPVETESGYHKVFVYGTLRFAPVRWVVKGRAGDPAPHTLSGFRREGLNLHADRDAEVDGYLLKVSGEELRRLDRYERLGIRYQRKSIRLEDGREVWIYRRLD